MRRSTRSLPKAQKDVCHLSLMEKKEMFSSVLFCIEIIIAQAPRYLRDLLAELYQLYNPKRHTSVMTGIKA